MAHRWKYDGYAGQSGNDDWLIIPLDDDIAPLESSDSGPTLLRSSVGADSWVLIGSADTTLNGEALRLGVRVLRDRDAIATATTSQFFGTERAAHVQPFPGAEKVVYCPRDKQVIEPGSEAVRCPGCGLFVHESAELPCYSCSSTCVCGHPSNLDGRLRWTPADL